MNHHCNVENCWTKMSFKKDCTTVDSKQWDFWGTGSDAWKGSERSENVDRGAMGVRTPPKAGTPSKKGCKGRQGPQEGGHSRDTKGVQTADTPSKKWHKGTHQPRRGAQRRSQDLRKADTPSKNGQHGSQDPPEGEHTIQQRDKSQDAREGGRHTIQHNPRSGTKGVKTLEKADTIQEGAQWESKASGRRTHHPMGVKTFGKADAQSKKGYNGSQNPGGNGGQDPWEGGHTIQHNRRRGTKGVKTLRKADTPSNTIQEGEHTGYRGSQDCREGGHTIQHHAGHLNIALRTPNSTLFGENAEWHDFKLLELSNGAECHWITLRLLGLHRLNVYKQPLFPWWLFTYRLCRNR